MKESRKQKAANRERRRQAARARTRFGAKVRALEPCIALHEGRFAEKTSDLLVALAEPMLNEAESISDMQEALKMAAFAWNLSLFSPEKRRERFEAAADQLFEDAFSRRMAWEALDPLVADKLARWPEDPRSIVHVEVTGSSMKQARVQAAAIGGRRQTLLKSIDAEQSSSSDVREGKQ